MNLEVAHLQAILAKQGIRVNALLPGYTATQFGSEDGLQLIRIVQALIKAMLIEVPIQWKWHCHYYF